MRGIGEHGAAGSQFRYHLDDTIDDCLNCAVSPELCTGGEGVCPVGCQFYEPMAERRARTPRWLRTIREAVERMGQ